MSNKVATLRFNGSISGQTNSMLIRALTKNDPEIMAAIPDFFEISKIPYDGGQTIGSRASILMQYGLKALLEGEQRASLTTYSPPAIYSTNEPQKEVEEAKIESDMDTMTFVEDEL